MTEEEALYLLKEYYPIIGFRKYRKALEIAVEALEKKIESRQERGVIDD